MRRPSTKLRLSPSSVSSHSNTSSTLSHDDGFDEDYSSTQSDSLSSYVVDEILNTERNFVNDMHEIVTGYIDFFRSHYTHESGANNNNCSPLKMRQNELSNETEDDTREDAAEYENELSTQQQQQQRQDSLVSDDDVNNNNNNIINNYSTTNNGILDEQTCDKGSCKDSMHTRVNSFKKLGISCKSNNGNCLCGKKKRKVKQHQQETRIQNHTQPNNDEPLLDNDIDNKKRCSSNKHRMDRCDNNNNKLNTLNANANNKPIQTQQQKHCQRRQEALSKQVADDQEEEEEDNEQDVYEDEHENDHKKFDDSFAQPTLQQTIIPQCLVETLFCNLEQIYEFNKQLLMNLEEECFRQPGSIAKCFLENAAGFSHIYTLYCISYTQAVTTLSELLTNKAYADILQKQQLALRHNLPLGAYLLKPVQRILKYHLLFSKLIEYTNDDESICDRDKHNIDEAHLIMSNIACQINEALRLQQQQQQSNNRNKSTSPKSAANSSSTSTIMSSLLRHVRTKFKIKNLAY